jgi:hypothetical protein
MEGVNMVLTMIQLMVQPQPAVKGQPVNLNAEVYSREDGSPLSGVPVVFSYFSKSVALTAMGVVTTDGGGIAFGDYVLPIGGEVTFLASIPDGLGYESTPSEVTVNLICGECEVGQELHKTCWDGEVIPYKYCDFTTCWEDVDYVTCSPQPTQPFDMSIAVVAIGGVLLAAGLMWK